MRSKLSLQKFRSAHFDSPFDKRNPVVLSSTRISTKATASNQASPRPGAGCKSSTCNCGAKESVAVGKDGLPKSGSQTEIVAISFTSACLRLQQNRKCSEYHTCGRLREAPFPLRVRHDPRRNVTRTAQPNDFAEGYARKCNVSTIGFTYADVWTHAKLKCVVLSWTRPTGQKVPPRLRGTCPRFGSRRKQALKPASVAMPSHHLTISMESGRPAANGAPRIRSPGSRDLSAAGS
jgi:hypothetical protein